MEAVAGYVLRMICGSLICGLILSVSGAKGMMKSLCGLYLVFLAISPLRQIDPDELLLPDPWFQMEAERLVMEGQEQSREAFCRLITEQYQAYILSRAAELSLVPEVRVDVDAQTGAITRVELHAQATPYEKTKLTELICRNLGIERSSIHWKT